ncbi:Zn-dependent hydrolase [Halanaerobium sp. MA284_MarDTE_T2]|uniref:Zn-dependent hydrolase n=1 Tax=Halanaerobium sp. MA284_MarDTE_T2 TaxID=2183913 RepID=UPI002100F2AD|nr:Zn-dependent hydrolase [Halanaerobium sp. MA284_MarDTE_T2]
MNLKRLKNSLEKINSFNSTPEKGISRLSFSSEYEQSLKYLISEMEKLDMGIYFDEIGNLFGKYSKNTEKEESVMVGSHIDSVKNGGRFDGVVGVMGALEVIRTIDKNNIALKHPIELVAFVEEEGTTFGSTLLGSKFFIDEIKDFSRYTDDDGVFILEKAEEFTIKKDYKKRGNTPIKAVLEMHVEQGNVLYSENITIGVVTNIAGVNWLSIVLKGQSNHAGSTPMHLRKDPFPTAGLIINEVEKIAKNCPFSDTLVGTAGSIKVTPNVTNVIPSEVEINVDVRDISQKGMDYLVTNLKEFAEKLIEDSEIELFIDVEETAPPIKLSDKIMNIISEKAEKRSFDFKHMHSGAVHDSSLLAKKYDVGMIFVPSIDGISHAPEEATEYEDIEKGANVLLDTVLELST